EQPVVTGGGVTETVDGLEGDVDGGVEPDGDVGAVDVVVDGGGDAHDRDALLGVEPVCAAETAVSADDHQAVDAALAQRVGGVGPAFRLEEGITAGRAEDGASALDDVGDAAWSQLDDVVVDQALIAAVDAGHAQTVVDGGANDGTDARVHARCVAAAGEHADMLHGGPV